MTPAMIVTLVHYIAGLAVLGCLIGFGVVSAADGLPILTGLIGIGTGGGLALINPATTGAKAVVAAPTAVL